MRRLASTITLAVLVAGGSLLLNSCARTAEAQPQEAATAVPAVAVAKAVTEDLSRDIVLTAEFKPYQEIDVMAKVAGYIKMIRVDVGDRVKAGDLLATLEVPEMADDLRRAAANVERGEAEMERAGDELQRAESNHELAHISFKRLSEAARQRPGLIAQQEIDDARSKDLASEAQVSAAKSALASAKQQVQVNHADVAKVKTMMEYTRVTAPFTGVITRRFADLGSMIQAGTASQTQAMPVVRLSQDNLLRLILPVPESAVPTVHIGQPVEVRVPTLNRTFAGRVARFANTLSLATRTMDTEVDVPNPGAVLIPGMYADVNLTLAQRRGVITVPVTAVDPVSGDPHQPKGTVMVLAPGERLEKRTVALGLETPDRIEIRSGLNDGDLVVIGSRAGLEEGEEVRPKLTALQASIAGEDR